MIALTPPQEAFLEVARRRGWVKAGSASEGRTAKTLIGRGVLEPHPDYEPHPEPHRGILRVRTAAPTEPVVKLDDRFWSKVDKDGPIPEHRPDLGACWMWTSCLDGYGYGSFWALWASHCAHTLAYTKLVGSVGAGLVLDHLCRRRNCVNPAHLEPVTNAENILRGQGAPAQNARKTHCPRGHPYDAENTHYYRGARQCLACIRGRTASPRRTEGVRPDAVK